MDVIIKASYVVGNILSWYLGPDFWAERRLWQNFIQDSSLKHNLQSNSIRLGFHLGSIYKATSPEGNQVWQSSKGLGAAAPFPPEHG